LPPTGSAAIPLPPAPPPGVAKPAPGAAAPATPALNPDADVVIIPSIMFPPKLAQRLDELVAEAMSSRTANVAASHTAAGQDELLNQLLNQNASKQAEAPPQKVFPVFFLGSIIYTSRNEWSVWVNDVKFTNRNNRITKNFYVANLDKTHATIRWNPGILWPDLAAAKKAKTDAAPQPITLDEATHTVTFTLRPNQSFISQAMAIREGHYIDSKPAAAPAAAVMPPTSATTMPTIPNATPGAFK
jgi:hypothetical protein